ncbi:PREDICTED: uncharacterized protein LOC109155164 [Ipomoea nil]|uniref:uncharacterized protein LOC109155164 n=1 Tax=Ipomoea nil TaxID=35883 RepID=UPI000901734A|nr:PREDICTED: uncharacterized protein LOC109155164 [Ipomoea nil]
MERLQATWKDAYIHSKTRINDQRQATDWSPPPRNFIKCNVDAALSGNDAHYGAVLRDHDRRFVAARSGKLNGMKDPYVAETLAAKEALSWLKTRPERNIIFESDCLNFCKAFNSCISDFSYVGLIVKQCVSIAKDIGNVSVFHVKRSANCVAHELARATDSTADSRVWTDIPPACISNLLSH